MLDSVDAICAEFQVNTLEGKQSALAGFVSGKPDAERIASFIEAADPVIDDAIAAGRYNIAVNIAEAGYRLGQQPAAARHARKELHVHLFHRGKRRQEGGADAQLQGPVVDRGRRLVELAGDFGPGLPDGESPYDRPTARRSGQAGCRHGAGPPGARFERQSDSGGAVKSAGQDGIQPSDFGQHPAPALKRKAHAEPTSKPQSKLQVSRFKARAARLI